jgi:folate-binding protein YgfZ
MDEATIPLEAGIEDRAISMTKGCYVGQEIVVRVLHRGHGRVARRLVGLVADADAPPIAGDRLVTAHDAPREVGHVTSAVHSPRLRRPIALGYAHRDHAEPGTVLVVSREGAAAGRVTVVTLPFTPPAA